MSLAKRERMLLIATASVLGIFALDSYVLTPFLEHQEQSDQQLSQIQADIDRANKLNDERKRLKSKWTAMLAGGLKGDPADAEGQVVHAIRDWAREAGLSLTSVKPERPESKEALKEIRVLATANGAMDSVSKFLWKAQSAGFPVKMTEVQINSRNDGSNELSLQVKLSTLYCPPESIASKSETPSAGGPR